VIFRIKTLQYGTVHIPLQNCSTQLVDRIFTLIVPLVLLFLVCLACWSVNFYLEVFITNFLKEYPTVIVRVQLKCDGTQWHREGKWRGNWWMEWVASTRHTTLEHGVTSITTADAHTSASSSRLNWRPRRFKWTRPFCRKTKSGFCACAITFQTQTTNYGTCIMALNGSTKSERNFWKMLILDFYELKVLMSEFHAGWCGSNILALYFGAAQYEFWLDC